MNITSINSLNFKGKIELLTPMNKQLDDATKNTLNIIKKSTEKSTPSNYNGVITVRESDDPNKLIVSIYRSGEDCNFDYLEQDSDMSRRYSHGCSMFIPVKMSNSTRKELNSLLPKNIYEWHNYDRYSDV